jgi:hypothetical protein
VFLPPTARDYRTEVAVSHYRSEACNEEVTRGACRFAAPGPLVVQSLVSHYHGPVHQDKFEDYCKDAKHRKLLGFRPP